MTTSNFTPITKGNIKAIATEIKQSGVLTSRPDGLRGVFASLVIMDGFNYREIDLEHVKRIKTALANGQEPSDFLVMPIESDDGKRFGVIGGHHTYLAIEELMAENHPKFTESRLYDLNAVFPKDAAHAQLLAFNHNAGKSSSVIENARFFRAQLDSDKDLPQVAAETGISKSVICNSLKLLEGDAELIKLVESGDISATKARGFINKHGAGEATAYAKAHIAMKADKKSPKADNANETIETDSATEINSEAGELAEANNNRLAAKNHNAGLQMRSLSTGKVEACQTMITQVAARISEDGTVTLPQALLEQLLQLDGAIKEVQEHNKQVVAELQRLKN